MSIKVGGVAGQGCLTQKALRDTLSAALTTSQIFDAPVLRLYSEGPELNAAMTLADFTEPTNVTPAMVTGQSFGTPVDEPDSVVMSALSASNTFAYDGSGDAPTIVGYMLTDGTTSTANVLYAEPFDAPVTLDATTENLVVIPGIGLLPKQ